MDPMRASIQKPNYKPPLTASNKGPPVALLAQWKRKADKERRNTKDEHKS
jgi:hypothetical protein